MRSDWSFLFAGSRRFDYRCVAALRLTFEKSSGNVFADIGFANPEREQLKAHLTPQID